MAKSLSRIMGQIEKLQKEAAAIQAGAIARIRKEISDHGLTVEHLFGKSGSVLVGKGRTANTAPAKKSVGKKKAGKGVSKPPKFGDGSGNFWGGMGKRPEWLRAALAAGRSLEEFLIGGKKTPTATKKAKPASKLAPKTHAKAAPKRARASSVRAKAIPSTAKPSSAAAKSAGKKMSQAKRTAAKPAKVARKPASKKAVKAKPAPTQAKSTPEAVA